MNSPEISFKKCNNNTLRGGGGGAGMYVRVNIPSSQMTKNTMTTGNMEIDRQRGEEREQEKRPTWGSALLQGRLCHELSDREREREKSPDKVSYNNSLSACGNAGEAFVT